MTNVPTIADLLSDSGVIDALRLAYLESQVGREDPVEQGGFIVFDAEPEAFVVIRLPSGDHNSFAFPICPDGTYRGRHIVGSFHTHPNTGAEWQQAPSPQDVRLSCDYPDTMGPHQFVVSRKSIYHISNEGVVTIVGSTAKMLGLNTDESP